MSACFLKVLNSSLTAGWLVLAVVLLRSVLKKAPKGMRCMLWGLVALRLLLPFTVESRLSLLPSAEPIRTESAADLRAASVPYERIVLCSGFDAVDEAVNPIMAQTAKDLADAGTGSALSVTTAAWAWVAGVAAMLLYAAVSFRCMKRKVRASIETERNVFVCDDVLSPFILGMIRPKIYLPSGLDEQSRDHVLAHERAHIQRLDHIWKPLGFLLLSIHWFNPLIWVAFVLLSRDIEFACDEKVVSQLDVEGKAAYSHTLLAFSRPQGAIPLCPVAFGEVGVKERVKSVLCYQRPALWVVLTTLIAGVAVAICFLTTPKQIRTAQAREQIPASAPALQLPKKLTAGSAEKEAPPEEERQIAPVPVYLTLCVNQQCDVAE